MNYARATSAAAAAAAALPLLLRVYAICSTAAMRRLSIDATGANISQAGKEGRGVRLKLDSTYMWRTPVGNITEHLCTYKV